MTKYDAILKAADSLFSRDGYGLTGVDALAASAGVTKRTLYKHFGSKAALFEEWLRVRDARTRAALIGAVERMASKPADQLLALFDLLAMLPANPEFHGCPFSRALIELGSAEANAASRLVAAEHKRALSLWFSDRLTAAGVSDLEATADEIALLYEGALQRIAATGKAEPAITAKRLLSGRLGREVIRGE
jgi:AcrR family transcriptional regulator